jgi:hypothetical protein
MNNEFTEPSDELKRVAEEIGSLRRELQNTSGSLGRIERRLKASFPNYPAKTKEPKDKRISKHMISSKSVRELQAIFESLVLRTQENGDSAFAARIEELTDSDIVALAVELGIGSTSKLSRRKAADAIRKRVQEAMQLQFENKGKK